MGIKEVYLSLRDTFPQVDIRILKAVAIEHEKDADAAAEFIITEVLPSLELPAVQGPSSMPSAEEVHGQLPVEPSMIVHEEVSSGCVGNLDDQDITSTGNNPVISLQLKVGSVECETSHVTSGVSNANAAIPLADDIQNATSQTFTGDEEKETQHVRSHLGSVSSKTEDKNSAGMGSSSHYFKQDLNAVEKTPAGKDTPIFPETCNVPAILNLYDESEVNSSLVVNVDVQQYPTTISTGSGQIVSIDFLEDLVNDAKSNKKTLVSELECIISLVKEVEIRERDACEVKYEAARAGMDILAKVDDLKKMLARAKETNYMHTGEVYGEKSILSTEARELQSRLLSLSGQRDKSLSVIEEMRVTLEARLAAAETERMAAAEERLVKEERALQELHDQENIMKLVIQESKTLMCEAEENSKLRDFLMDRGRIVDELQGEIAVVCEDILALKDKIDRHTAISNILQSSHLSSSDSSLSPKNVSLLETIEQPASSGNALIQTLSERENAREQPVNAVGDPKVNLEDDWDLFEADVEMKI